MTPKYTYYYRFHELERENAESVCYWLEAHRKWVNYRNHPTFPLRVWTPVPDTFALLFGAQID